MKNFTLGLNIALVLGVAALFYLHFSDKKAGTGEASKPVPAGAFKIAYFEMDSLEVHFEYYKEIKAQMEAKGQANNKILQDLRAVFAQKYQDLQKAAPALSQAELAAKQQELAQMDKAFAGKEKMLSDEMQAMTFEKLTDVRKKIQDYVHEYNKSKGYAYIFSSVPDFMYYKDGSYDITADVLKGLNATYTKK